MNLGSLYTKRKNVKEELWGRVTWWELGGPMEKISHENFLAVRMAKVPFSNGDAHHLSLNFGSSARLGVM